ncbi:MAG: ATP-binding cassette domain-containing protein [Anaerolineae bacterium]|jgi:simple sugar transport system ATP-binding protein
MHVELRDIKKYFGPVRANDGISLVFQPGHIYGLLGENGAGKSTLMKILSGYQSPTSGELLLDGEPVAFSSPSAALNCGIGMLYQEPQDFPPLQVIENHLLAYDSRLLLDRRAGEHSLRSYAERFGFTIDPYVDVRALTLGERQQMELMRLLSLGAQLLILDEPTTGISAEQKEKLFGTMHRLAYEEAKTIVLVSHKLDEVQELCDEVAVLRRGLLVGTQAVPCANRELVRLMFGAEVPRSERASATGDTTTLLVEDASIHTYRLDVEVPALEARAGEVIGLAGLEGSGQRLFMEACAGLRPLQSGKILLDGEPVEGKRSPFFWTRWLALMFLIAAIAWLAIRWAIGSSTGLGFAGGVVVSLLVAGTLWMVGTLLVSWTGSSAYHEFQRRGGAYVAAGRLELGLISGLTITEHRALTTPVRRFLADWDGARQEMEKRIERFNIIGQPGTPVDELSGGNQQRVMIALLNQPLRLLLLEHPTRGLDVTSANFIWERFQDRCAEGTTIVFMSADLDELLERSDRIMVFSGGSVIGILNTSDTSVDELGHSIGGQAT